MSILYVPKLFLTNQNFANILETSIKVLPYQKIANGKKWRKMQKMLSCCLGAHANWIGVKIKFAFRLERMWIAEKRLNHTFQVIFQLMCLTWFLYKFVWKGLSSWIALTMIIASFQTSNCIFDRQKRTKDAAS